MHKTNISKSTEKWSCKKGDIPTFNTYRNINDWQIKPFKTFNLLENAGVDTKLYDFAMDYFIFY